MKGNPPKPTKKPQQDENVPIGTQSLSFFSNIEEALFNCPASGVLVIAALALRVVILDKKFAQRL